LDAKELAGFIDHTLLKANAVTDDIIKHCRQAIEHGFYAVAINQRWTALACREFLNSPVKVASVVSLPLGADLINSKVAAATEVIFEGADEVDMVADLAAIIEKDEKYFTNETETILRLCRSLNPPVVLKVIIESAALTDEQIIFACRTCNKVGVDFVKTSTGMNPAGGAKIEHVKLMKQHAPDCKIKAAGGIKTATQASDFINAGAERIGTSSAVEMMEQLKQNRI
jgi:deoxyribose-phosphate aldolase